jgi:hypothetical protein
VSGPERASRLTPWGRLVAVCAIVVVGAAATLLIWSVASSREHRMSYTVGGALNELALDVGDADVVVAGAGRRSAIGVEHVDRFGFGHAVRTTRTIGGGVFRIRSRCPDTVLHACSVAYRLQVPDNVPIVVRTGGGSVRLDGYRGSARIVTGRGDVDVRGFCGFSLMARSDDGGDVAAATACPPQQLSLRTTTGSVHATVPPGRYHVDASTSGGEPQVRGVAAVTESPFTIQAVSGSGPVSVEGRR